MCTAVVRKETDQAENGLAMPVSMQLMEEDRGSVCTVSYVVGVQ